MAYVVIARWTAKEGHEAPVTAALEALAGPTREEPGNVVYLLHRDPKNPRVFVLYEEYDDEDAYKAHAESPHFQAYAVGKAFEHLERRDRDFLEIWDPGA